ncbi:hypothetical protein ERO13_D11G139600v2 [Gossypium hirsutum]|uniref:Vacuolar protein sorting-associated protein 62-like n=2 Tax=Gossypium TaxID=3633 RepID=A0A1U8L7T3_GOSHI|nr:uncharacterized protein LOC107924639 [Gossypium hirsutum]KAB2003649.1 hypothetical protein ES319_D11G146400v1 [Gossypium barbadense]KAG4120370.1 hypothetical protein ERO13_D11G139600v2 [Gossypium hirsutum]
MMPTILEIIVVVVIIIIITKSFRLQSLLLRSKQEMFGCQRFYRKRTDQLAPSEPQTFSLRAPLPPWPQGQGFALGKINLGELEAVKVSRFKFIWSSNTQDEKKGVTFYKPIGIPDGFYSLGYYCQSNDQPFRGFVLVAREIPSKSESTHISTGIASPALREPVDYTLVWSSNDGSEERLQGCGFFWLPQPPEGYKSIGYLVTCSPKKPKLDKVRCVRADLTERCENYQVILDVGTRFSEFPFQVWSTRPSHRGMLGRGVSVWTFSCNSCWVPGQELPIACLKNLDPTLHAMPNCDQIHALINHYGPTVFFHPDEIYMPSSVSWFFENGALLFRKGDSVGQSIDVDGSNLPSGGRNDGEFWIDLPSGDRKNSVKSGNLGSAKLYVHVKPALGGTFTDIAMWIFCPFNGPATLKVGVMNYSLSKIGQHVGDWEHFTLRICNFTGELWSIYFSQHSGGVWVNAYDLEYIQGNKAIVYSSKNGHATFPHPGTYMQGSGKLGLGIRNDVARSNFFVDSSTCYELVAAEYLGDGVVSEPGWLQFMRKWGPTIVYDISILPLVLRYSMANIFIKLPVELYGEEGPTGPKEKNNWVGDERG